MPIQDNPMSEKRGCIMWYFLAWCFHPSAWPTSCSTILGLWLAICVWKYMFDLMISPVRWSICVLATPSNPSDTAEDISSWVGIRNAISPICAVHGVPSARGSIILPNGYPARSQNERASRTRSWEIPEPGHIRMLGASTQYPWIAVSNNPTG